jgi:hypothetical protein
MRKISNNIASEYFISIKKAVLVLNITMQFHLLTALHPTAAVCGQPRDIAKRFLKENGELITIF